MINEKYKYRVEGSFFSPLIIYFIIVYPIFSASCGMGGKVMFSNHASIFEFDVSTQNVTLLVEPGSNVYALDYDYKHGYVYFPRHAYHDIMRYVD